MKNLFSAPPIAENFDSFRHSGGFGLPEQDDLLDLQEKILGSGFVLNGERRQLFTNLETGPQEGLQQDMRRVLENACDVVSLAVERMVGKRPTLDPALSAIWVETESAHSNLAVHRDSSSPDLVRATFSISPTRTLPSDVVIPISDEEWGKFHYPMGTTVLPEMERKTTRGALGGIELMTGTTYHRAPDPGEIYGDFRTMYGTDLQAMRGSVPRVFGSIWGEV